MNRRFAVPLGILVLLTGTWARGFLASSPGMAMTEAASGFLAKLTDDQRKIALLAYDTPRRVDWHFIPKDERKGLQVKDMEAAQRTAALALLQSALSAVGYEKATKIMSLEALLRELEKQRKGPLGDPERYFFTVFGKPDAASRWGLSVEGHHLSLNFVVDQGRVIS
ncbi:MAG: DUF3500 domain-containing protein, partial [Pirellulaceae bacterium]